MTDRVDATLAAALAEGLLPVEATRPAQETRPWPVVLLTALGAWLAAIPLLVVVAMVMGDFLTRGSAGPYMAGLLLLGASVAVLRAADLPLFVEQLAVPGLLVGGGSLAFGVLTDLPGFAGALVLALVVLALALAVPRPWLRVLLGGVAAAFVGFALIGPRDFFNGSNGRAAGWLACHALLALWAVALAVQGRVRGAAALIESVAAGWLLTTVASLAWLAGMSFLVGGILGNEVSGGWVQELMGLGWRASPFLGAMQLASAVLAAVAMAWCARAWPSWRRPIWLPLAAVLLGLAWLLPPLGGALLALAVMVTTQRWRQAGAAAVAAVWIVGSFYYLLTWPLATKAGVLAVAGAVLGVLAWRAMGRRAAAEAEPQAARLDLRAALVGAATLVTLAVAGGAIWQKQALIAKGRPVFVDLAPVDPRSLMQGDFMRLRFRLPEQVWKLAPPGIIATRPMVVARQDERGVTQLLRPSDEGAALGAGEFLIELTPKNGGWVLVTDAWFFKEGDAERWAAARYGEFRVTPDGRALLVGMADAQLKPIRPEERP